MLCIDNEPKILEGMQLLISGWGCEVKTAASLAEANERLTVDGTPDLIVADYHLDSGDGIEAIRALRAFFKADIPALLLTADRSVEVRAEAERHTIAVQHKPVKPAALRAYLTQVSGLKRAAAE